MHVTHEPEPEPSTLEARVGRELQRLRVARGWTQKETARRIAVLPGYESWHQTTVARVESAKRPLRLNEIETLATLFGVSLWTLIGAGSGLDAETLDAQIKETEGRLKETERAYDKAVNAWRNAETELSMLETDEREAFGQMTLQRATLDALRRAREQLGLQQ